MRPAISGSPLTARLGLPHRDKKLTAESEAREACRCVPRAEPEGRSVLTS
jgi:hypothetical protein